MHIHLIGVAGTGMGALAGLLKAAGHRVTGSDTAFYPPMGDALRAWGVETRQGFSAQHLSERPDLVVVGNVCRKDNPEARAAIDGGLRYTSMPGLIEELFVTERPGFVIAGTHGKTTTTALVAWLLQANGKAPGFLVGGIPKNFGESFALGGAGAPFVVEGDEYDSAFFEKSPKFWRYRPWAAVLTSVEQDHIDIYPTMESYRDAFRGFVARIPKDGVLAAFTGDAEVRALAEDATCRVRTYALSTDAAGPQAPMWMAAPATATAGTVPFDLYIGGTSAGRAASPLAGAHNLRNVLAAFTGDAEVRALAEVATCRVRTYALSTDAAGPQAPMWMAAPATATAGTVPFDLYIGGTSAGRAASPLAGAHNLRNVLGALAIVTEGAGVELRDALGALAEFQGVRRRQDLLAVADGVRIYDDFAHHPTAVYETLLALRQKHPEGKLIAIFEPRSATASRKLHEAEYPAAFAPANEAILAPVGRAEIPEAERLSVTVIGKEIETRGGVAFTPVGVDAIVDLVAERASPGDTVVLMSNGGFGNIYEKLPARLVTRAIQRRNA